MESTANYSETLAFNRFFRIPQTTCIHLTLFGIWHGLLKCSDAENAFVKFTCSISVVCCVFYTFQGEQWWKNIWPSGLVWNSRTGTKWRVSYIASYVVLLSAVGMLGIFNTVQLFCRLPFVDGISLKYVTNHLGQLNGCPSVGRCSE